jgi:hypothetical protein
MVKILTLVMVVFLFSGCSVMKAISAPFKNTVSTVPQSSVQGKSIIKCNGELTISKEGVITCTKGYYSFDYNSNIQERIQFFNNLMGWSFWVVLGLLFLCPSVLGLIVGRLFEGVYGMGAKAFKQVSTAIQKIKDTTPTLVDALEKSTDADVRAWIDEFKKKNNIK